MRIKKRSQRLFENVTESSVGKNVGQYAEATMTVVLCVTERFYAFFRHGVTGFDNSGASEVMPVDQ